MNMLLADRRRILGPTDSTVLSRNQEQVPEPEKENVFFKLGTVENSAGSSFFEGRTTIQTSIYGPKPLRGAFSQRAELSVDVRFSRFCDISSDIAKDISLFLESCFTHVILLDLYPKSAISIIVNVISVSTEIKNLVADALNSASTALVDAGICLSDIATAGSFMQKTEQGSIECVAGFVAAKNSKMIGLWIDGDQMSEDSMHYVIEQCEKAALETRKVVNNSLFTELEQTEAAISSVA